MPTVIIDARALSAALAHGLEQARPADHAVFVQADGGLECRPYADVREGWALLLPLRGLALGSGDTSWVRAADYVNSVLWGFRDCPLPQSVELPPGLCRVHLSY